MSLRLTRWSETPTKLHSDSRKRNSRHNCRKTKQHHKSSQAVQPGFSMKTDVSRRSIPVKLVYYPLIILSLVLLACKGVEKKHGPARSATPDDSLTQASIDALRPRWLHLDSLARSRGRLGSDLINREMAVQASIKEMGFHPSLFPMTENEYDMFTKGAERERLDIVHKWINGHKFWRIDAGLHVGELYYVYVDARNSRVLCVQPADGWIRTEWQQRFDSAASH